MNAASLVRTAREKSGLSLRALARRAGTSHSTLAAYAGGRVDPTVDTLDRIVRAAGFTIDPVLNRSVADDTERSQELLEVLELAALFPARHERTLVLPKFGPRTPSP